MVVWVKGVMMAEKQICISRASITDVAEILELQRLAYQSEAVLYNDWSIPPLKQTLENMQHDLQTMTVLKACEDGRIVGSVRGALADGCCQVGRLIVHPDFQRRGIGSALLRALEAELPQATCFELFTGSRSEANIRLYQRLGYRIFVQKRLSDAVELVYLGKTSER